MTQADKRIPAPHGGHRPVRTCVGCRGRADKPALLRVARTPRGVVVDRAQRAPGRGAYVHRESACVDRATRRGGLARRLRASMSPEDAVNLRTELEHAISREPAHSRAGAAAAGVAFVDKGQS